MDELIKSDNAIFFEKGEEILFFHPVDLSVVWSSDHEIIKFFNDCDGIKRKSTLIEKFGDKYDEFFHVLYENGFIKYVGEEDQPSQLSVQSSNYVLPVTKMYLLVSQKCNFSCKYCYAGGDYGESGLMNIETAKKSIDYFLTKYIGRRYELTLFGGEPLLNKGVVKESIEYASMRANELNRHLDILIATNGSVLDENLIALFKEYKVSVQISIDGFKENQNFLRPFNNGKGSFDIVFKNLQELLNQNIPTGISATVTKYNVSDLVQFYLYIKDMKLDSISFVLFSCLGQRKVSPENMAPDLIEFSNKLNEIANLYIQDWLKDIKPDVFPLKAMLDSVRYGGRKRFCGAGSASVFVNIKGNTYPCAYLVGSSPWNTGNVKNDNYQNDHTSNEISKKLDSRTVDDLNRCVKCPWRYICGGGCAICTPIGNLVENSPYARNAWCIVHEKVIPELLWNLAYNT